MCRFVTRSAGNWPVSNAAGLWTPWPGQPGHIWKGGAHGGKGGGIGWVLPSTVTPATPNATGTATPLDVTAPPDCKVQAVLLEDGIGLVEVEERTRGDTHDELVFEVGEQSVDSIVPEIVSMMEQAADLSVPLVVDAGRGANWDEAH